MHSHLHVNRALIGTCEERNLSIDRVLRRCLCLARVASEWIWWKTENVFFIIVRVRRAAAEHCILHFDFTFNRTASDDCTTHIQSNSMIIFLCSDFVLFIVDIDNPYKYVTRQIQTVPSRTAQSIQIQSKFLRALKSVSIPRTNEIRLTSMDEWAI